jgi:hypothetical protein
MIKSYAVVVITVVGLPAVTVLIPTSAAFGAAAGCNGNPNNINEGITSRHPHHNDVSNPNLL